MKRGVYSAPFVMLFFMLSFSFVTAADYTCSDANRIFRISANTNAHGEVFNGASTYLTHICYDDYFGSFSGTPSRACTTGNVVVRLSDTTNAHAERAGLTTIGYTNICFDQAFSCTTIEATSACSAGYTEIVSLSGSTNAHLGIPGQYTGAGAYRVCCRVGASVGAECSNGIDDDGDTLIDFPADPGCTSALDNSEASTGSLAFVRWNNAQGSVIGESVGIGASVNHTVRLVAHTSLGEGTPVTFDLLESDGALPDDFLARFTGSTDSSGTASITYRINDQNVSAALNQELASGDELEFYFYARALGQENQSELLLVNLSAAPNVPPIARISHPLHRGVYYRGSVIEFREQSLDPEGTSLRYNWSITEDQFTSSQQSFNYTLSSAGQKTITLRVTDTEGMWNEAQIAILVVASPGMFAFISDPDHQQLIVENTLRISLGANDSYVINSQGTCPTLTVTCLAGICPAQTQNSPPACGGGPLPIQSTPQGFGQLYFDWSFSDGDSASSADGLGRFDVMKQFSLPSSTLDDYKRADLRINYTNTGLGLSLQGQTSRLFTLLGADQCVDNGQTWVEYDENSGQVIAHYATATSNRCRGFDSLNGTADDCCPDRHQCTDNGCIAVNESRCADYTQRSTCRDDPFNLARVDPGYDAECRSGRALNGTVVSCSCTWVTNSSSQSLCAFSKQYFPGTTQPGPQCIPSRCDYLSSSPPSACVNGYATVSVQTQFIAGTCPEHPGAEAECLAETGQQTILCGRPSISLDFFGPWQFVITLLLILGGSWLWMRRYE